MQDLHELPKLRDSVSYLYIEHAIVDRKDSSIEFIQKEGRTQVPVAALCVLMLGPGTSVSHAAVKALAESGCLIVWTGEDATRCYAQGLGETRKGYHLLRQAELVSDPARRLEVIRRMYRKRFPEPLDSSLTLEQIRGMEGSRVRSIYYQSSKTYGVPWHGRRYDRGNWGNADPVNRALSAANALLNGICHAAIVSGGYSPGLGFIHTGRQTSFVYDIADLYKAEITIPLAFQTAAESPEHVDGRVRLACRQKFKEAKLLDRILPDIDDLLGVDGSFIPPEGDPDSETSLPAPLWDAPVEEADDSAAEEAFS
ncbi:MAG: type I-E CRISPR-associated endonuclease Cas1 [Chloroflexi bacterium]|nr:type I-E CRISPR-associated endonuclease Cas1 [Chloroflexota bacterium]